MVSGFGSDTDFSGSGSREVPRTSSRGPPGAGSCKAHQPLWARSIAPLLISCCTMLRFFACRSRHLPDADMHGDWPGHSPMASRASPRSPQEPEAPVAKEPLPETPTPVGKPVTLTPQTTPAKTKSKPAPKLKTAVFLTARWLGHYTK